MATKSQSYDHPTYVTRYGAPMGEIGGGATTQYAKFNAFTGMTAYSATFSVTVAGTTTGADFIVSKISGTATTALATATLGTSVAGSVVAVDLSTASGGVPLVQGDILTAVSGADTVVKAAVTYEVNGTPGATVTA